MFDTVVVMLPPPAIVSVSVPIVTTSSEPESAPIVRLPATVAVEAAVSLPSASTVIIGTAEADPYEPAVTDVAVNCVAPIEPSAILADVTALSAILALVTESVSNLAAVIEPSGTVPRATPATVSST